MKLRTYAIIATLALIAALTNPGENKHYAKLQSAYPWVEKTLLATAKLRFNFAEASDVSPEQAEETLWPEWLENRFLSYRNYGFASAVFCCPLWDPCSVDDNNCSLKSFGLFGFVFLWDQTEAVLPSDEIELPAQAEATPSTYVIQTVTEESKDNESAAAEFFAAYKDSQKAEAMLREGRKNEAKEMFTDVLEQLEQIKAQAPDWQPLVMEHRLKRTREHLSSLKD